MKLCVFIPVLILMSCGQQGPSGKATDNQASNAARNIILAAASHPRGDERASSVAEQEAVIVVRQYFTLIMARKYAEARLLWGNGGADSKSDDLTFANSFDAFSEYRAEVGNPTKIKSRDGNQYISVQAKLRVKLKKNGDVSNREGSVLLKRSSGTASSSADRREWRIWGVDLRQRH